MNYRHAFHAGNHADVLKHLVLLFCLDHFARKPAAFAVLDTHAGRGFYDLAGEEAQRSPEWRDGVGRLEDWAEAPAIVRGYCAASLQRAGEDQKLCYRGSPLLIAGALRAQDRLIACELHPEEHAALKAALAHEARAAIHRRDGYEGLLALTPFPERRGLVLIDPPYEANDELARAAEALARALKRFGHGVYVWWRPLKSAAELARYDGEITAPYVRADVWVDAPTPEGRLNGSSLMIVNAPHGLEEALAQTLPALAARLGRGRFGARVARGR